VFSDLFYDLFLKQEKSLNMEETDNLLSTWQSPTLDDRFFCMHFLFESCFLHVCDVCCLLAKNGPSVETFFSRSPAHYLSDSCGNT